MSHLRSATQRLEHWYADDHRFVPWFSGKLSHLIGSFPVSLAEDISWGKFVPLDEGGRSSGLFADATVGLPIMCAALFEQLGQLL